MMKWMDASPVGSGHDMSDGAAMTEEEARIEMGMASADEITALQGATGQQADCLFLGLLIRHHEGAIPMAEALIELGSDSRALTVAENIKNGQTAEIDAMKSMRARMGCE